SYGDPGRDPRMPIVTVAYLAFAPDLPEVRGGSDASAAAWIPVDGLRLGGGEHDAGPAGDVAQGVERGFAVGDTPAPAEPDAAGPRPPEQGPGHGIDGGDSVPRPDDPHPAPGSGALPLAFDHARIVADGLDRAR